MTEAVDLASRIVYVWRIAIDGAPLQNQVEGMSRILSAEEAERAARFYFEEDRARFVASHAVLRRVLGRCLGRDPAVLRFRPGPRGKPELEDGADVRFNLSHSGGIAVVAVCRGMEVGVDVERVLPRPDLDEVARRYFSAWEVRQLEALAPGEERLRGFYSCWTRKEAWLKARGIGLALPLNRFSVDVDPDLERPVVVFDGDREVAAGWALRNLPLGEEYAGAVAAPAAEWSGEIILNDNNI